jgi:Holliday junction resolvase RusA-like endonuclease
MKAIISRTTGRALLVPANEARLKRYTAILRNVFQQCMEGKQPINAPILIAVSFRLPCPKSRRRKKEKWVTTPPDIDKLERALLDAMTGIIFNDDAQVAMVVKSKIYSDTPSVSVAAYVLSDEVANPLHYLET